MNNDLISRQAAIEAINKAFAGVFAWAGTKPYGELVLRDVPAAQPERKTGKWILNRSGLYCCSECMEPCATYVMMKPRDRFCKMCGAEMQT